MSELATTDRVPAECLAAAARMLPRPEYCADSRWSVESDAGPEIGWARFSFKMLTGRHGQRAHRFWCCYRVEPTEPTDAAPF